MKLFEKKRLYYLLSTKFQYKDSKTTTLTLKQIYQNNTIAMLCHSTNMNDKCDMIDNHDLVVKKLT